MTKTSSRVLGPLVDRLHNHLRDLLAPLDAVVAAMPGHDVVVDLGCGQGLLLQKLPRSARRLVGVDFDARKCRMARELLADRENVEIVQGDVIAFLEGWRGEAVDAVSVVDTLSSIPPKQQERTLELAASILRPGGRLLLKVVDTEPPWKAAVARGMYLLVYRVLRLSLSADQQVYYRSGEHYKRQLESLGLRVHIELLHRQRPMPVPHILIVGERPA